MKRSDRQRAIGRVVLGSGLVAAAARYWVMTRDADLAINDATALGYNRSLGSTVWTSACRWSFVDLRV
jgi:hypothetical protein